MATPQPHPEQCNTILHCSSSPPLTSGDGCNHTYLRLRPGWDWKTSSTSLFSSMNQNITPAIYYVALSPSYSGVTLGSHRPAVDYDLWIPCLAHPCMVFIGPVPSTYPSVTSHFVPLILSLFHCTYHTNVSSYSIFSVLIIGLC